MTMLSPALDAALSADSVTIFGTLELSLPGGGTLRLLDGAGEIAIGGHLFGGEDPAWGVWAGFDAFEDGTGDEAPGFALALHPANDAAASALSGPAMQGQAVSVRIGAIDRATGLPIGEPFALFEGEVDVTRDNFGRETSEVELECVGGMERLFFNDEGIRLAPAFHEQVWPGEEGLLHVTGVPDSIYWGARTPSGSGSGGSGAPWQG